MRKRINTRRVHTAAGLVGVMGPACGAAVAQPDLEPGRLVVIAEAFDSPDRGTYLEQEGVHKLLNALTFGPDADLPPLIPVDWFDDRAQVRVANGDQVIGFTQFGDSGSEPAGIWGTGGVAMPGIVTFDNPIISFEDPLLGFDNPIISIPDAERLTAIWGTGGVAFDNPIISVAGAEEVSLSFADQYIQVREDGLYLADTLFDSQTPIQVSSSGPTITAAASIIPGTVMTDPRPDLPGGFPILAYAVEPFAGKPASIYQIWGTNGASIVDGQPVGIWGTSGTIRVLSSGGLLSSPSAMLPVKTIDELYLTNDVYVVLDNGSGLKGGGGALPRLIGIEPDGSQRLITEGGNLVNPTDIAFDENGNIVVADPDAFGGEGGLIRVEVVSGEQSVIATGGAGTGWRRPVSVSLLGCQKPTYTVNSPSDSVDANPGDGLAEDALGQTTLRAAIMEANASPCGGATIHVPAGTFSLSIAGQDEDVAATGDLDITADVSISGAGVDATTIDASDLDRIFDIHAGARLVAADLTVTNGDTSGGGGGIRSRGALAMTRTRVERNVVSSGGGGILLFDDTAEAVLIDTEVYLNRSTGNGGGIVVGGPSASEPNLLAARCLMFSNASDLNGGGVSVGKGEAEFVNTTFSNNTCEWIGGAIHANNTTVTLDHCSVIGNQADEDGQTGVLGGGLGEVQGLFRLSNTIVAKNETSSIDPQNFFGEVESLGYNLFEETADAILSGDLATIIVDPNVMIGPLADNGGFTQTHALLPGSPAIDAGDPADPVVEDQRAEPRPVDGDFDATQRSDIGAFELAPTPCAGDVDGDGDTDIFDFNAVVGNFGTTSGAQREDGDLTGDGAVNVFDYNAVTADFGCDNNG